jgi:hypothetical protein
MFGLQDNQRWQSLFKRSWDAFRFSTIEWGEMASYYFYASRFIVRGSDHRSVDCTERPPVCCLLHVLHVRWCTGDLLLVVSGVDST